MIWLYPSFTWCWWVCLDGETFLYVLPGQLYDMISSNGLIRWGSLCRDGNTGFLGGLSIVRFIITLIHLAMARLTGSDLLILHLFPFVNWIFCMGLMRIIINNHALNRYFDIPILFLYHQFTGFENYICNGDLYMHFRDDYGEEGLVYHNCRETLHLLEDC